MNPLNVPGPDPGDVAIEAHGLTRYFGQKCAADGLSFAIFLLRGGVHRVECATDLR
jgi:hypothetical protein